MPVATLSTARQERKRQLRSNYCSTLSTTSPRHLPRGLLLAVVLLLIYFPEGPFFECLSPSSSSSSSVLLVAFASSNSSSSPTNSTNGANVSSTANSSAQLQSLVLPGENCRIVADPNATLWEAAFHQVNIPTSHVYFSSTCDVGCALFLHERYANLVIVAKSAASTARRRDDDGCNWSNFTSPVTLTSSSSSSSASAPLDDSESRRPLSVDPGSRFLFQLFGATASTAQQAIFDAFYPNPNNSTQNATVKRAPISPVYYSAMPLYVTARSETYRFATRYAQCVAMQWNVSLFYAQCD